MKKLIALAGSAALLFSMAGGVLAFVFPPFPVQTDEATVKNYARVSNDVYTKSETGDNEIHGKFVWGGKIKTGEAWASGTVFNTVNANSLGCGCYDDLYIKNKASVRNEVTTKASSGDNSIGGQFVTGGYIRSGSAGAESYVENVVNTNLVGSEQ